MYTIDINNITENIYTLIGDYYYNGDTSIQELLQKQVGNNKYYYELTIYTKDNSWYYSYRDRDRQKHIPCFESTLLCLFFFSLIVSFYSCYLCEKNRHSIKKINLIDIDNNFNKHEKDENYQKKIIKV